jgi:hypothetical protein
MLSPGRASEILTSAKQAHTFLEDRRIARPPGNSHLRHAWEVAVQALRTWTASRYGGQQEVRVRY